ncbi:hypothetical protein COLO4_25005 [Corchorus olitorius]|uniref:SHSP domain-containing protein n=1 Tax=Corchorus olitorius TaxID=93759 RepID=A0A1R3I5D3_9ROSI|nr:hypothetical protein COLO4_25005 [Corchorus olitorius]
MSLLESLFRQNSIDFDPFPPMNWKETPHAHIFEIDLPGLTKEDVKLQVDQDRVVHINGERKEDDDDENEKGVKWKWHCRERKGDNFIRQFRLPENANVDEMKASMRDGVLVVTVPKHKYYNKKIKKKGVEISGEDGHPPKGIGRFVCCKA